MKQQGVNPLSCFLHVKIRKEMTTMTAEMIIQLITSFGIIPALFVWLLMYIMSENKKDKEDSRKREIVLMEHITKSDILMAGIMQSVENVNNSVGIIQTDIAVIES